MYVWRYVPCISTVNHHCVIIMATMIMHRVYNTGTLFFKHKIYSNNKAAKQQFLQKKTVHYIALKFL